MLASVVTAMGEVKMVGDRPFPRCVRAEQQVSRAGDTGKARQGRSADQDRESGGAYASRTPRRDDVGTTLKRVFGIDIETCAACGGADSM